MLLVRTACLVHRLSYLTKFVSSRIPTGPKHKLQGRFLHITDIHPDPHYRPGMSEDSACHRKKPKKAPRRSGEYGMAYRFHSIPTCKARSTYANLNLLFSSQAVAATRPSRLRTTPSIFWTSIGPRTSILSYVSFTDLFSPTTHSHACTCVQGQGIARGEGF